MTMKPRALFVIQSDPRSSHRPAEAVRAAAGIGAWQRVEVAVYLRGPALLLLSEDTCGLVDEDNLRLYLPVLQRGNLPVLAQANAPELARLGRTPWRWEPMDEAQLAALAAESACVLVF